MDAYDQVLAGIADAERAAGRPCGSAKLVAVSKTFPVDSIQRVYDRGQRIFGESRVEELMQKATTLPHDIEWHFIGHLQNNKVKKVLEYACMIHSVDSIRLLERIDRLAGELGKCPQLLLEVNVSGEVSKYGFSAEELPEAVRRARELANIELSGLMTMAPLDATEDELLRVFSALKSLADNMEIAELSMGMSGDYVEAIACGATLVRIGSAIFGGR